MAVLHGPATAVALDDHHYREKYQFDNPDRKLIDALKRTEVVVYVCGQALAHKGFESAWVNPGVDIALAALTVLSVYQLDGYALIPE